MGAGKSTIGASLAEKLQLPFWDLDDFIQEKEQKTISEIFKNDGEIYFRRKESAYLSEMLQAKTDFVLSLGGGTPCFANNMAMIKRETPFVFYLRATAKTLVGYLKNETHKRPLLAELQKNNVDLEEFINKHLFERNPFYLQANFILSIENQSVRSLVIDIENKIKRYETNSK